MIGSGSRARLIYVSETVPGTLPATPAFKTLRSTSRKVDLNVTTVGSNEVRADRQVADVRHGFNKVNGTVGFEFSRQSFDDVISGVLASTWGAVTVTSANYSATAPNLITRATGDFVADGLRAGDVITTSAFTNSGNNGTWVISSVTTTVITVTASTITTEASGGGKSIVYPGKRIDVGQLAIPTFSIERGFLDVGQYQLFHGCAFDKLVISIKPDQMVTGTVDVLGMSADPMSGTSAVAGGSLAAPNTNSPFSAFDGLIIEAGSVVGVVTALDLTITNSRTTQGVVGSKFSPGVFEGTCMVSGTMTVFFQDATFYNKFINETESSLSLKLNDLNGSDFLAITIPRLKYNGHPIDPQKDKPIEVAIPIVGLVQSTLGTSISFQRSNTA